MTASSSAIDVSAARVQVVGVRRWIPAFAGMTARSDNRIGVDGIIPAKAGMTEEGLRADAVRTVIPASAEMTARMSAGVAERGR